MRRPRNLYHMVDPTNEIPLHEMKRRLIRFAIAGAALIVLCCGLGWYVLSMYIGIADNTLVFIPQRSSIRSAVDSIHVHCNLPTPWFVSYASRLASRFTDRPLQSGWYLFTESDTQLDVLISLFNGKRRPSVRVTIPEGLTYKEIAGILARVVDADSAEFVQWCDSVEAEGYLMPETYDFFWREDATAIGERLSSEWRSRMGALHPTPNDVVMASIVQAEAVKKEEMPTIAGVYHNRLKRGMKLEADPTVQYGLGQKRRVLYRDLDDHNSWNTYVISGLPPTPINNPGIDALRAAMNPQKHEFLFFVAKGNNSGEHLFARTGQQHIQNVKQYRSSRR